MRKLVYRNSIKPKLYISLLSKLNINIRRNFQFTTIVFNVQNWSNYLSVITRLQNVGLILGVLQHKQLRNKVILQLHHTCIGGKPIRRAALLLRSNIKYNRTISVKQLRRLVLWGYGSDILIATAVGVVSVEYCLKHQLGGRIVGTVRGYA